MTLDGVRAPGARSLRLLSSGPLQIAQRLSPSALNGVGSRLFEADILHAEADRQDVRVGGRAWLNGREVGGTDPRYTHLEASHD